MSDDASFYRYANSSRHVIVIAQEEARGLDHAYTGPEHILLGLMHVGGAIADLFIGYGTSLPMLRQAVVSVVGRGAERREGPLPFLAAGQKSLSLAVTAADLEDSDLVHPEHLLRGLLAYRAGAVPLVLQELGIHAERLLRDLRRPPEEPETSGEEPRQQPVAGPVSCGKCRGDLRENLAWTVVETRESGDFGRARVRVAYCTKCGTAVVGRFDDPDAASPAYV